MVRSTHAHAKILSIDTSEAEKLPGVKAILTAKDFKWPGKLGNAEFAVEFADREVLVTDKVRRIGDDIAAVAAIDEETAQRAVDLIKVEYEDIPAVFDPFEAMKDGAPWVNGAPDTHNVGMATFRKGGTDPDEEFANAAFTYSGDYETHRMVHAAIEPHAATASYENGVYTIWMVYSVMLRRPVLVFSCNGCTAGKNPCDQAFGRRWIRRKNGFLFLWYCGGKAV